MMFSTNLFACHLNHFSFGLPVARTATQLLFCAIVPFIALPAHAQDKAMIKDTLNLDASVSAQITPDTAVITMAVERQGADAAPITNEVNQILAASMKEAKATKDIQASSGAFTTYPRYDNKGQRSGWVVRAEQVYKSKDFVALGKLAGKLSASMQIVNNNFEVSPELKQAEEEKLIADGLAKFQSKARAAVKALGYTGYTIKEVALGSAFEGGGGRPPMPMARNKEMMSIQSDGAPVPLEAGQTRLTLNVNGSVLMK
jgi:predicted secreted protein